MTPSLTTTSWQRRETLHPSTKTRIIIWHRPENLLSEALHNARYTVSQAVDSLQISFSVFTTKDDIRRAGKALVDAVELLREVLAATEKVTYMAVLREEEMLCRVLERYCISERKDYPVDVVDQLQQYVIALDGLCGAADVKDEGDTSL